MLDIARSDNSTKPGLTIKLNTLYLQPLLFFTNWCSPIPTSTLCYCYEARNASLSDLQEWTSRSDIDACLNLQAFLDVWSSASESAPLQDGLLKLLNESEDPISLLRLLNRQKGNHKDVQTSTPFQECLYQAGRSGSSGKSPLEM